MTRFTRVKSTHQRVETDSTPWTELKQTPAKDDTKNHRSFTKNSSGNGPNSKGWGKSDDGMKKGNFKNAKGSGGGGRFKKGNNDRNNKNVRFDPEQSANFTPLGGKNNPNVRGEGESKSVKIFGNFWVGSDDARRLQGMAKKMKNEGVPRKEILQSLQNERRKAEKANRRRRDKTCYNCRQFGHVLSDCPSQKPEGAENGDGVSAVGGQSDGDICFKCGSTEHTSRFCKRKADKFNFAKCFVCSQTGHIARQCPTSTKGIYPAGGCCDECGAVTHLKKDCPELQDNKGVGNLDKDKDPLSQVSRVSNPFVSTEYEEIPVSEKENPSAEEDEHENQKPNSKLKKIKKQSQFKRKIEEDINIDNDISEKFKQIAENDSEVSKPKPVVRQQETANPKKRRVKF